MSQRAREAPSGPGVYLLLGAERELLYVGKATNLKRRLADHARGTKEQQGPRLARLFADVAEVHWLECADERAAFCHEADLIVGLLPRFNASIALDAYTFITLDEDPRGRFFLRLGEDVSPRAITYGGFAHLGKGKASWPGVRTNAGYSALLRLLWVAGEPGRRLPTRLRGSSPPVVHQARIDPPHLRMLRDLLSGTSDRLVRSLAAIVRSDAVDDFMRRPLIDDVDAARTFFELGPKAVRRFRLDHGLPRGPVDLDTFRAAHLADLAEAIGPVVVDERPDLMSGRRTARSLHMRAMARPR